MAYIRPMMLDILINTCSVNGVLPDDTKPLPEQVLPSVKSIHNGLRIDAIEICQSSISEIGLKNINPKLHWNLQGGGGGEGGNNLSV